MSEDDRKRQRAKLMAYLKIYFRHMKEIASRPLRLEDVFPPSVLKEMRQAESQAREAKESE